MKQLGLAMSRAPSSLGRRTPAAAYTYFGQFIDHDLTDDETPFARAGKKEPPETPNKGGGRLDLHPIYGYGPASRRHGRLYEGALFRLGKVMTPGKQLFDLPLDLAGGPMCADERSKENLILRQIAVLFMKLHNLAVAELPDSMGTQRRFAEARIKVTWQYQWLVMQDFLFQVMQADEYNRLAGGSNRVIDWKGGFAIPVEFSQAAFRFGHSMVRPLYLLHNGPDGVVDLKTVIAGPHRNKALQVKDAIDWDFFLASKATAMSIDTRLAPPLFDLPNVPLQHGNACHPPHLPAELPVRTLVRGARTGLPTGEETAKAFCLNAVKVTDGLPEKEDPWLPLRKLGLIGRTPLWYYVLLEAEVQEEGATLGALGSRLVGEVIAGSLQADCNSYLIRFGGKRPPEWKSANGRMVPIDRLLQVAKAVGL